MKLKKTKNIMALGGMVMGALVGFGAFFIGTIIGVIVKAFIEGFERGSS
jgi:hypothetical protein